MTKSLDPFRFLLIVLSGWMNQQQSQLIDYLREENRVLREQLGHRRLRFNDDQRRRLAARAKGLGSKLLREVATIVTPETLLAWHRRLIAKKYDGSGSDEYFDLTSKIADRVGMYDDRLSQLCRAVRTPSPRGQAIGSEARSLDLHRYNYVCFMRQASYRDKKRELAFSSVHWTRSPRVQAFSKIRMGGSGGKSNSCSFESNNDPSSETPYPFSLIRTQFQAATGDSEFLCAGMRVLPPCSLLLRFVLGDAGENDRFTVWKLGYQG